MRGQRMDREQNTLTQPSTLEVGANTQTSRNSTTCFSMETLNCRQLIVL